MPEYKKFDEKIWMDFGKNLLKEKGSKTQKEFLKICKSGKIDFLNYIDEHLLSVENSIVDGVLFDFSHHFSEAEFRFPPKDTQETVWNKFKDIPVEIKHSFGFWGYTIINMIESDCIKPVYLCSRLNGVNETGILVIDKALDSKSNPKTIDDCIRRILRSMCNPAARGKRIIFNDFYLGKSYWRWHWSQEMSKLIDLEFEQILEILDESYYGVFAEKMHTGKSYIGSNNVLGGLLLYLKKANDKQKIPGKKLRKLIDKISWLSAWKAIEVQEPRINQKEIQEISTSL